MLTSTNKHRQAPDNTHLHAHTKDGSDVTRLLRLNSIYTHVALAGRDSNTCRLDGEERLRYRAKVQNDPRTLRQSVGHFQRAEYYAIFS